MDKEIKNKWIEALRSGKYQQGCHYLRGPTGDRYCCFGVLCDILDLGWDRRTELGTWACEGFCGWPPPTIQTIIQDETALQHLVRMNDDEKNPFSIIADYIEERL